MGPLAPRAEGTNECTDTVTSQYTAVIVRARLYDLYLIELERSRRTNERTHNQEDARIIPSRQSLIEARCTTFEACMREKRITKESITND